MDSLMQKFLNCSSLEECNKFKTKEESNLHYTYYLTREETFKAEMRMRRGEYDRNYTVYNETLQSDKGPVAVKAMSTLSSKEIRDPLYRLQVEKYKDTACRELSQYIDKYGEPIGASTLFSTIDIGCGKLKRTSVTCPIKIEDADLTVEACKYLTSKAWPRTYVKDDKCVEIWYKPIWEPLYLKYL